MLTGVVFTALIGVDISSSMAYQGFALLAAVSLLAFAGTMRFQGRFSLQRRLPRYASAGEPFGYTITVRNESGAVQRGLTLLEEVGDPVESLGEALRPLRPARRAGSFKLVRSPVRRRLAHFTPIPLPDLATAGEVEVTARLWPQRRGPLRFMGARVSRTDPFGLLRTFVRVEWPQTVLVLPKRYKVPSLALPGHEAYQVGGVAQAAAVGQSEEFVSLRHYRRGDPMRHIHWRSWARIGEPIVKEFEDEFFVRHGLVLDTFDDPDDPEPFEEAVSVAASFACAIGTQESLLDLMFVGVKAFRFTAGRGLAQSDQLLEILACARLTPEAELSTLSALVMEHLSSLTACVCVLLKWDPARQELVRRIRQSGIPLRVLVVLPRGTPPPADLGPMADRPGAFRVLHPGSVEEELASLGGS